ncbi:helix-turn-helix domain-containing protein [Gloeocapsopsis dulcis]|uniref:DNA-binding protein n=1 Tax=Gloeocapsopsis dulcis AAB1 = 1H9 TaxID=1433147 RepID=A0A6N8FRN5_9CHRO|nr:helix-turn-helix domain-containing protein [Gloeocapsopsis dulcis]MUL34867.1 DNA-binding protein [Gloeocapsopsis dulcis AAB1 = 1H9]WNN90065.1 helix-turn-helix domain-containing protein [Gloeocapsopsis dulcis]
MLSHNAQRDVIVHSQQLNDTEGSSAKLVGSDGEATLISESIYQVLHQVVQAIKAGQSITVVSQDQELTTQQAADLLNVSRPYLIKLLEQGEIPHIKVGTHRRVRFQDLMQYKEQRDRKRRKAMKELTQFLQEEGFYNEEIGKPE